MEKHYSWLQFSDLHIFDSTDWILMQTAYEKLSDVLHPDFLVFTGDFRHIKKNPSYTDALAFLEKMVALFHLKKEDVFLVPGNHDVNDYTHREEIITTIKAKVEQSVDVYGKYLGKDSGNLRNGFIEYRQFVADFYGDDVHDDRTERPEDVLLLSWKDKLNIIILNTALISTRERDESEIIDLKAFSKIKTDPTLPTIVLAHHDINSLTLSHRNRVKQILEAKNVSAVLCGDKHKIGKIGIERYSIPNTTVPVIICGKSAIESEDPFSDLSVIEYEYRTDGNTYVQVYEYKEGGFLPQPIFYYDIIKQFNFPMYCSNDSETEEKELNATTPIVGLTIQLKRGGTGNSHLFGFQTRN